MTVKFQIARRSGSKPVYIFLVALCAFNLGRYSEHFSGSGWAWLALSWNVLFLCWLSFSMFTDYRKLKRLRCSAEESAPFSNTLQDIKR
jgi:hypothetical protein